MEVTCAPHRVPLLSGPRVTAGEAGQVRAQEVQPAHYSEFLFPSAPFLLEDPTQDPHDMVSWSPGSCFLTFLALMMLAVWGHFAECPSIWICRGFSSWLWVLGRRFPSSDLGFETRSLAAQTGTDP